MEPIALVKVVVLECRRFLGLELFYICVQGFDPFDVPLELFAPLPVAISLSCHELSLEARGQAGSRSTA